MHAFHSDSDEKTPEHFQISSPKCVASHTSKPFIRRCSEPMIVVNKDVQNRPVLSRSQTEIKFYGHHLTKQISDECVLLRKNSSKCPGELMYTSKDCSCCSTSSLESTFSSNSESTQTSSPIISPSRPRQTLQRKQSLPHRQVQHGNAFGEITKKRSQSMKYPNNRMAFSRGGASKRAQKALRHSQTLPDVLPLNISFLKQQKPRRVSSEEVFQQVDCRLLSDPPSYRQAIQDVAHTTFALSSSMTVEAARCLSNDTCSQTTFLSAEPSNVCLVKNCTNVHSCRGGEKSHDLNVSTTSPESGLGCLSETVNDASNSITHCYSQQLLESLDVRESYV